MNLPVYRLLSVVLLPVALASCGGDDSASGAAPPDPGATLSGSVVAGITANAVITVTDAAGNLLATTESNAQGAWSVNLDSSVSGAVLVSASAKKTANNQLPEPAERTIMRCDAPSGCFDADGHAVDFADWFDVPLDFTMSAVLNVNGWGLHMANITPLSTLAADWAQTFPQGLDPAVVSRANDAVTAMFALSQGALEDDTSDLADLQWLSLADPQQLQLALLYAAFAEIAHNNVNGYTLQQYLAAVSNHFASQGGALLQDSIDPSAPSLAEIIDAAQQILLDSTTLGGVVHVPVEDYGDVPATLADLRAQLNVGLLTSVNEVSYDDLIIKLGDMGAQIDQLLTVSGLKDLQQFVAAQWPHFSWLTGNDTLNLLPLAINSVAQVVTAAVMIDLVPEGTTSYEMYNDGLYSVTLDVPGKTLNFSGETLGQTVNLQVGLTSVMEALASEQQFVFSVAGTVTSATAAGQIDAVLSVDASGNNLLPLQALITATRDQLLLATPEESLQILALTMPALMQLAAAPDTGYIYTLVAHARATGSMSLQRYEEPAQSVVVNFDGVGDLDLGATGVEPMLTATLNNAGLTLPGDPSQPAPNQLYAVAGKPVMAVTLAQDLVVTVDGAATGFNVPEAVLTATGGIDGVRTLIDQGRATLTSLVADPLALLANPVSPESGLDDLLAFDFSLLHAWGNATITIADWNHEYRASLDDFTVTLYQPHSADVALTAELVLSKQKVHFLLGAEKEPWDLRTTLTPTPGVLLVGPEGQYARLEQEDLYALLDTLQVRELLSSFLDGLFPPAT